MRTAILLASLWCVAAHAQIVLDAANLALQPGDRLEFSVETYDVTLADLDIDLGETGGPLEVDFTTSPPGSVSSEVALTDVLPLAEGPDAASFPEADYVMRLEGLEGIDEPVYYYVEETEAGSRILGITGLDALDNSLTDLITSSQQPFPDFYPLSFGKIFDPIETPFDFVSAGVEISGSLNTSGSIDAWGTVTVPAGQFQALRLSLHGEGSFEFEVEGETVVLTQQIDQFTWMAPSVGTVANIQEVRVFFPEDAGVPPIIVTQLMTLHSFSPGPTAVEQTSWGSPKAALGTRR